MRNRTGKSTCQRNGHGLDPYGRGGAFTLLELVVAVAIILIMIVLNWAYFRRTLG